MLLLIVLFIDIYCLHIISHRQWIPILRVGSVVTIHDNRRFRERCYPFTSGCRSYNVWTNPRTMFIYCNIENNWNSHDETVILKDKIINQRPVYPGDSMWRTVYSIEHGSHRVIIFIIYMILVCCCFCCYFLLLVSKSLHESVVFGTLSKSMERKLLLLLSSVKKSTETGDSTWIYGKVVTNVSVIWY